MALMTVDVKDARVSVLVIRQSETYGSIQEGQISSRLNARVLNMAVEKAEHLWPGLPVTVLRPEMLDESQRLPKVQCLSLLHSDQPIATSGGDVSRMVLVHYENQLCPQYSEMTRHRLANIEWRKLAKSIEL